MQNGDLLNEENILIQTKNLESLIDYKNASGVSKSIINKKSGTVTLFAFDEGQKLSEHTTPNDAMVYIIDGEAEITISGKQIIAIKGEMIILPANIPHELKAISQFKMLLVIIK